MENKTPTTFEVTKSIINTMSTSLTATAIKDLRSAQVVIESTAALADKSAYLQCKAFDVVNKQEYWKLGSYIDERTRKTRKYTSYTDWATRYYGMSKADASVKLRTAQLIAEDGLSSIFPIEEYGDYSMSALGIIAQYVVKEVATGKKLKNGADELEKVVDIDKALELHNNGTIDPTLSVRELKKRLTAKEVEEVEEPATAEEPAMAEEPTTAEEPATAEENRPELISVSEFGNVLLEYCRSTGESVTIALGSKVYEVKYYGKN